MGRLKGEISAPLAAWHPTKPWEQSQGSREYLRLSLAGGDQEEEEAAGTSMDEPWQQVTAQPWATQPRARPLPLPSLPDLVILNMLSALSMTLQFRGTPSFFMSILHKIDAFFSLFQILWKYLALWKFTFFPLLGFFFISTRRISSLWFLSSADNCP